MGDILELITTRRTAKSFLPKDLSWDSVVRLVDAARHAPSCGNLQNWKFIVVTDPGLKQQLAGAAYDQYEIVQAAVLIAICAEPEKAKRYYGVRGEKLYSIQNCAAAAQNVILEAHSLGLGSKWIGAFDEDAVSSALGLPKEARPQVIVAVGHMNEIPPKMPKYPLEAVLYLNGWRSKMRDPAKYLNDTATIIGRKFSRANTKLKDLANKVVSTVKPKKEDSEE